MTQSKLQQWERFKKYYTEFPSLGLALDLSRTQISEEFLQSMEPRMQEAFADMSALEGGAIANPDENRMVGHYWLRNPAIAPDNVIRGEIEETIKQIKAFATDVHAGVVRGAKGNFRNLLLIGIGGSALGPQFVAQALGHPRRDRIKPFFFDNTDPDGMERILATIDSSLGQTLCVVISKSGGTKETRNGMLEVRRAYECAGLNFGSHAVAVTRVGSELDNYATNNHWIRSFPMWDWVGGRTSELSAVGLLPAALQGFDIEQLLAGARTCDEVTRNKVTSLNPSALLALVWFSCVRGHGDKNMVVLPYSDRLELFSKYLQQLIMESLGKRLDKSGREVCQGITVLGNKGSTDQHSYVQQLRDGINDFFVTFIEVLNSGAGNHFCFEPHITTGDYLHAFLMGTRDALAESLRESITITVRDVSPFSVGALIGLFERAVGLYASLININAYHQPGVEAGKKAAEAVIGLQIEVIEFLDRNRGSSFTAEEIASAIGRSSDVEAVFKICEYLAVNPSRGLAKTHAAIPIEARYFRV